jgi:hypothetical protein
MKTNPNLTIALSVSLLVFTSMYGATRSPLWWTRIAMTPMHR